MVTVMVVDMVNMLPTIVVWTGPSLECEPDELRFAFEPERSVNDELPDLVEAPVNRQYAARVWVLRDRSDEDVHREFDREVREGRHWWAPWLSVCPENHRKRGGG